ncbi:tetraacyldisaccharide 4'-kinase [Lutibacter sp. A80]|uniref:tetraacyldisaccharide 4'-kinase n=1 Tax=Lutibacter sp. A80 TaxID=2918453 RepID=UPI001F05B22F|nr:tetraacyldisaccharide 4'-kinase [Lutibacter sp. A80]UMB60556.1 tetraacyldisaccharide 4'-kinase [Lutibacter sp. A80]
MNVLRIIAYPFAILYGIITSIRNFLYDINVLKSTKFKTPTIVVGNLSVGGTGKTPQIEYLIRLLQNNYKIAVLSRGYKRKSTGFIIADKDATAELIGDEPYQFYKKFKNIIVCVDANRTNAIQQLEQLESPPDVILLDDAFQHRKVAGGFNILLTDFNNLYVNDSMLPTGNLREHKFGAKRAQLIVVTKCPKNLSKEEQFKITKKINPAKNQLVFFTAIDYNSNLHGDSEINIDELQYFEVLLVTGIANPTPLTDFLKDRSIDFKHLKYPDHYNFKSQDISKIEETLNSFKSKKKLVLTTEKDYVRIFDKVKNLHYISIKSFVINYKNDFDNKIINYVEQSTGNG